MHPTREWPGSKRRLITIKGREKFHHEHFNNNIDQSSKEKLDKIVLESTVSNRNSWSNKNRGRKLTIKSLSMRQKKQSKWSLSNRCWHIFRIKTRQTKIISLAAAICVATRKHCLYILLSKEMNFFVTIEIQKPCPYRHKVLI